MQKIECCTIKKYCDVVYCVQVQLQIKLCLPTKTQCISERIDLVNSAFYDIKYKFVIAQIFKYIINNPIEIGVQNLRYLSFIIFLQSNDSLKICENVGKRIYLYIRRQMFTTAFVSARAVIIYKGLVTTWQDDITEHNHKTNHTHPMLYISVPKFLEWKYLKSIPTIVLTYIYLLFYSSAFFG